MLSQAEKQWLDESLAYLSVKAVNQTEPAIEAMTGDASARQYYRIKVDARTFLFCRSLDTESNARFRLVASALEKAGVMAPLVFAFDDDLGVMLLSDLGNTLLVDVYQMNAHGQRYSIIHRVLNDLIRLAKMPDEYLMASDDPAVQLSTYNQALLDRDFGLFTEWCLGEALNLSPTQQEQAMLGEFAAQFQRSFTEQPQVWVHRDFHCRNLMLTDNDIGVIDFQDMVKGPVCYDLISLVYDAYWDIPADQKQAIVEDYYKLLTSEQMISVTLSDFLPWVAVTAMQRLIKVLGIFCRLSLRDGKMQYLADLPMVMQHLDHLHETYPEVWSEAWLFFWQSQVKPALATFLQSHHVK